MTMNEFTQQEFQPTYLTREITDEICGDCDEKVLHSKYDCEKNQEKLQDVTD